MTSIFFYMQILDKVISQVKKGVLGVNLFGKNHEAGEIISIVSAEKLSQPGEKLIVGFTETVSFAMILYLFNMRKRLVSFIKFQSL